MRRYEAAFCRLVRTARDGTPSARHQREASLMASEHAGAGVKALTNPSGDQSGDGEHRCCVDADRRERQHQRARCSDLPARRVSDAERDQRRHQHQSGAMRAGHHEGPERQPGVSRRRAQRAWACGPTGERSRRPQAARPPRLEAQRDPSPGRVRPRRPQARPMRHARPRSAPGLGALATGRATASPRRRRTSSRWWGSARAGHRALRPRAMTKGLP